ncbi:MAG: metallophosphoesterase [Lachnospiraceae bacterium]|nr:metallophosphoesterase [Lachnospiraceae bacterium]
MIRQERSSFLTGVLVIGLGLALTGCSCSRQVAQPGSQSAQETETSAESTAEAPTESQTERPTIRPFPEEESTLEETQEPSAGTSEGSEGERFDWSRQIMIGTDLHYLARSLTDGGKRFQQMVEHGDGKVMTYIEPVTDAFLAEVMEKQPDVLILSGDLTLDGEKKSHEELAVKLRVVEDAGIPVLVIPGNHDINNRQAARFQGTERMPAEYTTPQEFREIYKNFGYDEAAWEDPVSLSYVYQLDENLWFLMLDSCQYQPRARVGGSISSDTYDWIERVLEKAWELDAHVIPAAHHNLLEESEIYVDDCTIEHGEQLVEILDSWDISLFLSGHLHVQHWMRAEDAAKIMELVTSSLATPACQYGQLTYWSDDSFSYQTQAVDVESWAARVGRSEADLLNFNKFKEPFLRRVFYNQSYDALEEIVELSADQKVKMSTLYSELNYHYYQGTAYQIRDAVQKNPNYALWLDEGAGTELSDYLQYIVRDAKWNYNRVEN